ncbi:MAG: ABC transporter ATP-binding protein [Candidatus Margulisbacteria bacterium]|nr:ABC transporter ATP-binding protein [Candidatus Margulisiibacteriota bacterium]
MTETVINVENLSKCYVIRHQQLKNYSTLREEISKKFIGLKKFLRNPRTLRKQNETREQFYALKDINFQVQDGDRIGIIGRNGAGKSTLLKILSKITEPTAGKIYIKGKIASLLEVGTGFHPELSGRENIFLNGAILGMTRSEIKKKFDEIVAFSEIEKFLDTPVKRYSTGMYVRLAFSIAAHLEPDILIVDEVLAVGDAQFQAKCLGKMEQVSTQQGRTVLFVSHNMSAVQSLCTKGLLLKNGQALEYGPINQIVHHYLNHEIQMISEQEWPVESAPGNDFIRIKKIKIAPPSHLNPGQPLTVDTPVDIALEFWNLKPDINLNLSLVLWKVTGECIFNLVTESKVLPEGLCSGTCHIPGKFLNDDKYSLEIYFVRDRGTILYKKPEIAFFEILDSEQRDWFGKWIGAVRPNIDFRLDTAL